MLKLVDLSIYYDRYIGDANYKRKIIIKNINLQIVDQRILIQAPSGTGKSSLLNIIGLISDHYTGSFKRKYNLRDVGYIYQDHNLLYQFDVLTNIMLPLLIRKKSHITAKAIAMHWLASFNLENYAHYSIHELSGGQQQLISIIRGLIFCPKLCLADEITGNLDKKSANDVMHKFHQYIKEIRASCIVVTHDDSWNHLFDRKFTIRNEQLHEMY